MELKPLIAWFSMAILEDSLDEVGLLGVADALKKFPFLFICEFVIKWF